MTAMSPAAPRRGTVLILVAGLSALLASLAVSFLVRMRTDAEESDRAVRLAQAHIMLVAACNYIQETSRLGWDANPATGPHLETFGWVDIRDGLPGPRDQTQAPLPPTAAAAMTSMPALTAMAQTPTSWANITVPLVQRAVARQPMYVMRRPPFAVQSRAAPNPIATSGTDLGKPLAVHRDPEPVVNLVGPGAAADAWTNEYVPGDPTPLPSGQVGAWFRVLRDGPATFVITCGCGGTMGFRLEDWNSTNRGTAMTASEKALFGGDYDTFRELDSGEVRLWYRVEWSPNVAAADYQCIQNELSSSLGDTYTEWPLNVSAAPQNVRSQPHPANMVGTIRWVQRLVNEPTYW